ncbi:MAG: hypothetical protein LBJ47_11720 [Tannerella sp.]|nr:hypothetical protein [Tannerella sp.]
MLRLYGANPAVRTGVPLSPSLRGTKQSRRRRIPCTFAKTQLHGLKVRATQVET